MINLFPYFIARLAALPLTKFDALSNKNIEHLLHELHQINPQIEQQKTILCDEIFKVFKSVNKADHQLILLEVKRHLFNQRPCTQAALEIVKKYLHTDSAILLDAHLALVHTQTLLEEAIQSEFNSTLAKGRATLKQLVQSSAFKNGLLLSAPSLLKQMDNYLEKPSQAFRKKELQTELSLLKYITRMYTKTSPFGTFTNIGIEKPLWANTTELQVAPQVHSYIQISSYFLLWLEKQCLLIRDVYLHLELFVNHSTQKRAHQFVFYANNDNLEESFHKIEVSPLLEYIVELVKEPDERWTLATLVTFLVDQTDASCETLENYLYHLLSMGLLEISVIKSKKASNQEQELIQTLETQIENKTEFVTTLLNNLGELATKKETYVKANFQERSELLKEVQTILTQIVDQTTEAVKQSASIHEKLGAGFGGKGVLSNNVFYEDTFRKITLRTRPKDILQLIRKLDLLASKSLHTRLRYYSLMEANSLFLTLYGPDAEVDFLVFFEQYYIQIIQNKRSQLEDNETFMSHWLQCKDAWNNLRKTWENKVAQGVAPYLNSHAEAIDLDETLFDAVSSLEMPRIREKRYYAAFLQLFQDNGQNMAFLNSLTLGYGKMFSRFLNDEQYQSVVHEMKHWNDSLTDEEEVFIENQDESFFNANIHPPLMSHQIQFKNKGKQASNGQQLTLDELRIRWNTSTEEIELVHHLSGRVCRVFDLDFQTINSRSEMFKFLAIFDVTEMSFYEDILHSINRQYIQENNIFVLPRITFQSQIVLQRKTWVIPQKLLPQNHSNNLNKYFLVVNQWLKKWGLPSKVFVRLKKPLDEAFPANKDLYKPQYIDFGNPLVFRIFDKLVKKVKNQLILEELLPTFEQQLTMQEDAYVSEFVIQWTSNAEATENVHANYRTPAIYDTDICQGSIS